METPRIVGLSARLSAYVERLPLWLVATFAAVFVGQGDYYDSEGLIMVPTTLEARTRLTIRIIPSTR